MYFIYVCVYLYGRCAMPDKNNYESKKRKKERNKQTNDFYVVDKNLKSNERQQLHDHPKDVKKKTVLIYNLVD